MEFELAYYDIVVHHVSHYTTTPTQKKENEKWKFKKFFNKARRE